ncbi:Uncharacterised protein [Klebsiella pneumoniae]|nr:Uncharacterised protein [Klebsiella pneumoniae]
MIARSWPVTNDGCTARFNDVADGAQCIAEIFGVIFLVTTTKQRNQFAIEINLFESREEVIPVTLRFAIIQGWDAQQQNVISFQIFFAAFCNVMDIGNVFTKLFLNHFCDIFGITGVAAEKDASDSHE